MKKYYKVLSFFIAIFMALTLSACGGSTATRTYDRAQKALVHGNYEKAAELFESIANYEDASKLAMYSKALHYGEQKEYTKAIDTLAFLKDFKDSMQLVNYFELCALSESTMIDDLISAAAGFDMISAFRDSSVRADECRQKVYDEAIYRFGKEDYDSAEKMFIKLGAFKDSAAQAQACDEARTEKRNAAAYAEAEAYFEAKNYEKAIATFRELGDYSDSAKRVQDVIDAQNADHYADAEKLLIQGDYEGAISSFTALGTYRDSINRVDEVRSFVYEKAAKSLEKGDYEEAQELYSLLGDYEESRTKLLDTNYLWAEHYYQDKEYENAYTLFAQLAESSYRDSRKMLLLCASSGESCFFGKSGESDLEWIVVETETDRKLLISKESVGFHNYNDNGRSVWANSGLRKWLNGEFYEESFSSEEKDMILSVKLKTPNFYYNGGLRASGGPDTIDKLFVWSYDDLNNFGGEGYSQVSDYIPYRSWLRTPGYRGQLQVIINRDTALGLPYTYVNPDGFDEKNTAAVHALLWVAIDS